MDEFIKALKELSVLLPESQRWLIFLVMPLLGAGLIAYRYFFPDGSPNLLTIGERRRRQRIEFIEECLKSDHNDDENVVTALKEERNSLIFQDLTKLKVKRPMRQQLVLLHEQSPSRDTWKEIKTGYPSLKEKDGKLVKGVDRIDAVFGILAGVFGLVMLLTSFYLFILVADAAGKVKPQTIELGLFTAFLYLGGAMLALRAALPVVRAKQMQKYIPVDEPEKESLESKGVKLSDEVHSALPSVEGTALPPASVAQTVCELQQRISSEHGNNNAGKTITVSQKGKENDEPRT